MLFSPEKIIRLQSTQSTNDYLTEKLRNHTITSEGAVVVAIEQTQGKGMDNNTWESEPGKNLTFSFLLKPDFLRADQQFMLSKIVSLGVCDFVKTYVSHQAVSIKWPNDIYIDNKKIAGILISNSIEGNVLSHSVVGIGININQYKFPDSVHNPVSLSIVLRRELDLEELLTDLLYWLENRYDQLIKNEWTLINEDYLDSLYRLKEQHLYFYNGGQILASITGVSEYGQLLLITSHQEKLECDFKEIKFIIDEVIQ